MTIPEITVAELAERIRNGALVIDVREPGEWDEIRASGVNHIPLGNLDERADELPAGCEVYFICRSGARSLKAAEWAAARGHSATNVAGGTLAWVDEGLPTESG